MQDDFNVTRRFLGTGLAMGGAMAASGLGGGAASASVPDGLPTDPVAKNRAKVKITGSLNPGRVSWSTRGRIYAIMPDRVVTLYDFLGCETAWWEPLGDERYARYFSANSIFVEPGTTTPIYEYKSPFNGETVEVRPTNIRHKEGYIYTPEGGYFPSLRERFGAETEARNLAKWDRNGDLIRIAEEDDFPPFLAQPSREVVTMFARASEALDPDSDWADAHVAGWNIWSGEREPYKSMGVLPGCVNWHFDGVKIRDLSQLDPAYLAEIRRIQPQFDDNPKYDEGPTFFDMILQRMDG